MTLKRSRAHTQVPKRGPRTDLPTYPASGLDRRPDRHRRCPLETRGPTRHVSGGGGRSRDDSGTLRLRPAADLDGAPDPSEREGEAKLLSGGYSLLPLLKLRLAPAGTPRRPPGRRRARRHHRDRRRPADRRPGDAPPDPRERDRRASATRSSTTCRAASATRRSATGARSAAPSPTPTRPPTGRPRCSLSNATIVVPRQRGERAIKARDFFLDTFTTAIEPTEVLTEIRIPRRPKRRRRRLQKLERRVGDFATVGVAVVVRLDDGRHDRSRRHRRDRRLAAARSRRPSAEAIARRPGTHARTCFAGRRRRRAPRANPPRTSAAPSTTSGRWSRR